MTGSGRVTVLDGGPTLLSLDRGRAVLVVLIARWERVPRRKLSRSDAGWSSMKQLPGWWAAGFEVGT